MQMTKMCHKSKNILYPKLQKHELAQICKDCKLNNFS